MIISVTFKTYPEKYLMSGKINKFEQTPSAWYIQTNLTYNPDYSALPYSNQKYLYMFLFYDFSVDSFLRRQFLDLIGKEEIVSFYDKNQCIVLSNKKIHFYDYDKENFFNNDGELFPSSDDIHGNLTCAILN